MKRISGFLLLLLPAVASAQIDSAEATKIVLTGFGGALGEVTLGVSRPADVRQVLNATGGIGAARSSNLTFPLGTVTIKPPQRYNPPATQNQLYFIKDVLVVVVEGIPSQSLPPLRPEFDARYPNARETHREGGWYELTTQIAPCVWLIAVFGADDNRLQSDAYAYSCGPKR